MSAVIESIANRALEKLTRELGPIVMQALTDPDVEEVMLNPDGRLWEDRRGVGMQEIGTMPASRGRAIIETVAGYHGKTVTRESPTLEGELPIDGSRFAGQLPPTVERPVFAIRKRASLVFKLDTYVQRRVMTAAHCAAIQHAVREHRNILVIGGTGSGKTTLVNAIIDAMVEFNSRERIVIIEDTNEIQCAAKNAITYHTTASVSMTSLLKTTLRMRPDRILVGEVRGGEALDLLMAWNTGHEGGCATLHANDARAGLDRLAMLISMNPNAPTPMEPLIAQAVHVIVHITKQPDGSRIVREVLEVSGWDNGGYLTKNI